MSADAITICPRCGENELREFHEFYTDADVHSPGTNVMPTTVTASFSCTCRSCGFEAEFEHTHAYEVTP